MARWKNMLHDAEAAEIAEAAVVMPLMFMILLGIFWFGRAYNIYATVTRAANEGARVAATPLCATCGTTCGGNASSFPCDAAVVSAVSSVLQASKLSPAQINSYTPFAPAANPTFCSTTLTATVTPACTTSGNISICRGVQLNAAGSNPQECGSLVSFKYPYQFYFPFTSLNFQLINIPAASEIRMEY
jgi:hypothetical protein